METSITFYYLFYLAYISLFITVGPYYNRNSCTATYLKLSQWKKYAFLFQLTEKSN